MPFSLTNILVIFKVVINNIFIIAYLNNILVYSSRTLAKYKEHIKKIL